MLCIAYNADSDARTWHVMLTLKVHKMFFIDLCIPLVFTSNLTLNSFIVIDIRISSYKTNTLEVST